MCNEKIAEDEVRISKKDYESEDSIRISSYTGAAGLVNYLYRLQVCHIVTSHDLVIEFVICFGVFQDRWHHVDCFVQVREEFGFFESGKLIPG